MIIIKPFILFQFPKILFLSKNIILKKEPCSTLRAQPTSNPLQTGDVQDANPESFSIRLNRLNTNIRYRIHFWRWSNRITCLRISGRIFKSMRISHRRR
jgi:hypothetical protein